MYVRNGKGRTGKQVGFSRDFLLSPERKSERKSVTIDMPPLAVVE